jgi:acetylornithine deacetylase
VTTERLEAAIQLLERLVSFDTESAKSNLALVAEVQAYLRGLGVDFVTVPNAAGDKAGDKTRK